MVTILKWFFDIRKKTVQSFFLRKVEKIFDALSNYQHHYKKQQHRHAYYYQNRFSYYFDLYKHLIIILSYLLKLCFTV